MSNYKGPHKNIPDDLLEEYTLHGKIPVYDWYFDESNGKHTNWDEECINNFLSRYTRENVINRKCGNESYPGASNIFCQTFEKYPINNKTVAIIGSQTPWLEALVINHFAEKVTTVEYNVPICNHPKIDTMSYIDFEKGDYKFDVIITFSSIEHSGLGRYGDPLDPNGDIKTMNTIHKSLKEDGLLLWGAPVGKDAIVWNAHRVYGEIRFPMIFEKFNVLQWFGYDESIFKKAPPKASCFQPVIVAKKNRIIKVIN